MMNEKQAPAGIAKLIAEPLRLKMLQFLTWAPCSVAQLVEVTEATQPNVSNHLRLLREGGVVVAEKSGRHVIYRIASPAIAEAVAALSWAARGTVPDAVLPTPTALQESRICYDHLAGKFGIRLMAGLVTANALTEPGAPWDTIELGPSAGDVFERLGFDLDKAIKGRTRRRFAFACPDWSEHAHAHLGGLLGAALCEHCISCGWIEQDKATRATRITERGAIAIGWLAKADN
jgi:DNA-binding transcriptional ArsR family regulator